MISYNYENLLAGELVSAEGEDEDTVMTDDPVTPPFVEWLIKHLPNMNRVLKLSNKESLPMTNN